MPRLQHTSLTCEVEQAVPLRTRNPSPPLWRRGRGASLYQCSAAGGAHPGRRSPAQCRTKPRCPSLLCRPRRVTSPGKVASHRRARGFGRAAARGGHCELTPPGARGRREMSTFGDTSSQVQRRGETLRVNTSRHTGTARDEHLGDTSSQVHFCSETRRHSRPHTSSAAADGQVLDTAARACLYRTRHRKPRRRGPGQRRYPRTGAPRPRAAEAAAQRLRRDSRAADRRAKRQRRCCCCSAPTTSAPLLLLLLLPPRHAGRARRRRRAASGSRRAVSVVLDYA